MRTSLILAATLVLTGTAFAQMAPIAPTAGQFCVRGDSGVNKGIETCTYQTMAQCEAAKGAGEKCFPNAQLKPQKAAATSAAPKAAAPKAAAKSDKMKSAAGSEKPKAAAGSKSTTGSGSKN
jgi:Protein of unknown function (DUF3551)